MKSLRTYYSLTVIISCLLISACVVKEPEGPGEQIGKGIDMFTKGLSRIDDETLNQERLEKERLDRERKQIDDDRRTLDKDPYYDSSDHNSDIDPNNKDWNSERRY